MVIAMCLPGVQLVAWQFIHNQRATSDIRDDMGLWSLAISNRKNWIQIQALLLLGYVVEVFKANDCCKPRERSIAVHNPGVVLNAPVVA